MLQIFRHKRVVGHKLLRVADAVILYSHDRGAAYFFGAFFLSLKEI